MDMMEAKREMLREIMKMAGEARMKGLKAKHAPPAAIPEPAAMDERPPAEGEHEPLSDEDLQSLLDG